MKRLAAIPYVALCLCALSASAYCALELQSVEAQQSDLAALPSQYLTLAQSVEVASGSANCLEAKFSALRTEVDPLLGERVVDLPEDSNVFFLTVFTSPGWRENPAERQFLASLEAQPEWQSLKAQTAYHHYVSGTPMYTKYAAAIGNQLPCVLLQNADGKVLYKSSGDSLSADADELGWFPGQRVVKGIRAVLKKLFPNCPRPKPKPTPDPATPPVAPVTPATPPSIPDIGPGPDEVAPEVKDGTIPLAVGSGVVSLLVASVVGFVKRVHGI